MSNNKLSILEGQLKAAIRGSQDRIPPTGNLSTEQIAKRLGIPEAEVREARKRVLRGESLIDPLWGGEDGL